MRGEAGECQVRKEAKMKRKLTGIAAVALLLLLVEVSLDSAAWTAQPQYGGILKRMQERDCGTPFGWPVESEPIARMMGEPCLEMLVEQDVTGRIQPQLATDWKVAPDQKSITFTLRKGVKFHDGTDWNAEAAKFTLDAYLAAKGKSEVAGITSVDVLDDYTIRMNLSKYKNTILGGNFIVQFVSPTAVRKNGIAWARENPVGTGPFKFVSRVRDVSTKFERFDKYWEKGKPYLDGIEWVIIKDPMTAQFAFEAGEVHTVGLVPPKQSAELRNKGYQYFSGPLGNTHTLVPDSAHPDSPLADKRVRQAVEYAVDREAIAKAVGMGYFTVAYQVFQNHPLGRIEEARRYNPARAKQLLAEAGYPNGFKTKIFLIPGGHRDAIVAEQRYLGEVGIQANLEFPESAKYAEYRYKGWSGGLLADRSATFGGFTKNLEWHFSGDKFKSLAFPERYWDVYKQALSTTNIEEQKVQKVRRLMFDEAIVIPMYDALPVFFVREGVHDLGLFTSGDYFFWTPESAWLDKEVHRK